MGDFKSKLPDFKELGEITSKLFKDFRSSINEIVAAYKEKHAEAPGTAGKTVDEETVEPTQAAKPAKSTKAKAAKKDESAK